MPDRGFVTPAGAQFGGLGDAARRAADAAKREAAEAAKKEKEAPRQPLPRHPASCRGRRPLLRRSLRPRPRKRAAASAPSFEAFSKYDFVPGEKVVAVDDFTQDEIGDFPGQVEHQRIGRDCDAGRDSQAGG